MEKNNEYEYFLLLKVIFHNSVKIVKLLIDYANETKLFKILIKKKK